VLRAGALPAMLKLLKHPDQHVRKECCWALSSVAAGTEEQVQAIVDANIIGAVVYLLATEGPSIQKEAGWCIINAVTGGNASHVKVMVEQGCIKALCDLLVRPDLMNPLQPLEALEYVIKRGVQSGAESVYLPLVDLYKLKTLGEHKNPDVRKRAMKILQKIVAAAPFFGGDGAVVPQNLLTDRSASTTAIVSAGAIGVDVQQSWADKWSSNATVAKEAEDAAKQRDAAETLADTIYRDFFDGEDPFGVLEEAAPDTVPEVIKAPKHGRHRAHKAGKGSLARQATHLPPPVPKSLGNV